MLARFSSARSFWSYSPRSLRATFRPAEQPGSIRWRRCVMNDLKFAFRQLLKNTGFTAVAVLTLALGIGANTAIFNVVDVALLKWLPVRNPEQLYLIAHAGERGVTEVNNFPFF